MEKDFLLGDSSNTDNPRKVIEEDLIYPSIRTLNRDGLGFRIGKYPDEAIPKNQRNLTDFRTRIGTLLEYELSYAMQSVINENGIDGVYASNVIANKYPDLAIRGETGRLGVRMEVKSVQTVAEETAANFDPLLKDIRKGKDFLVLMIWNWEPVSENKSVKTPKVKDFFCFDGYNLATLRDCYWLNTPKSIENGYQGYDLTDAVTYSESNSRYKEEEGNYGKLMRIYKEGFEHKDWLPEEVIDSGVIERYLSMKKELMSLSFKDVLLHKFEDIELNVDIIQNEIPFFARVSIGDNSFLVYGDEDLRGKKGMRSVVEQNRELLDNERLLLKINYKFSWKAFEIEQRLDGPTVGDAQSDKFSKPDSIPSYVQENLFN